MSGELASLREALHARLRRCASLHVAYSGGVDSAYLAWEAHAVLGEHMLAVIADSPSLPRQELADAIAFTERHGIPTRMIATSEMTREAYIRNDAQRCFHCKDELFTVMEQLRGEIGFSHIAYGRNLDDDGEFRPGARAAAAHRVIAPLAEAGLGKQQVRELAAAAGLNVWDKPASACLASRLEYGRPVTAEALRQVEQSESFLREIGFPQTRVRHHGDVARVEVAAGDLPRMLSVEVFAQVHAGLRAAGFTWVAVDTLPYRSGSMNAALQANAVLQANALVPASALLPAGRPRAETRA